MALRKKKPTAFQCIFCYFGMVFNKAQNHLSCWLFCLGFFPLLLKGVNAHTASAFSPFILLHQVSLLLSPRKQACDFTEPNE